MRTKDSVSENVYVQAVGPGEATVDDSYEGVLHVWYYYCFSYINKKCKRKTNKKTWIDLLSLPSSLFIL